MIGVINKNKIFEFGSLEELIKPLSTYASKYSSNVIIITNSEDIVKCIIADENFIKRPKDTDLIEEYPYYIRFIDSGRKRANELEIMDNNDKLLPEYVYVKEQSFKYCRRPTPKELD